MEIKPCPFCGSKDCFLFPEENLLGYTHCWVQCDKCDSEGSPKKTHKEAIEAWNKREAIKDNE